MKKLGYSIGLLVTILVILSVVVWLRHGRRVCPISYSGTAAHLPECFENSELIAVGQLSDPRLQGAFQVPSGHWIDGWRFWCEANIILTDVIRGEAAAGNGKYVYFSPSPDCSRIFMYERGSPQQRVWFLRRENAYYRPVGDLGRHYLAIHRPLHLEGLNSEQRVQQLASLLLVPGNLGESMEEFTRSLGRSASIACNTEGIRGCLALMENLRKQERMDLNREICRVLSTHGHCRPEDCGLPRSSLPVSPGGRRRHLLWRLDTSSLEELIVRTRTQNTEGLREALLKNSCDYDAEVRARAREVFEQHFQTEAPMRCLPCRSESEWEHSL